MFRRLDWSNLIHFLLLVDLNYFEHRICKHRLLQSKCGRWKSWESTGRSCFCLKKAAYADIRDELLAEPSTRLGLLLLIWKKKLFRTFSEGRRNHRRQRRLHNFRNMYFHPEIRRKRVIQLRNCSHDHYWLYNSFTSSKASFHLVRIPILFFNHINFIEQPGSSSSTSPWFHC